MEHSKPLAGRFVPAFDKSKPNPPNHLFPYRIKEVKWVPDQSSPTQMTTPK
jgi:hypothetical protein